MQPARLREALRRQGIHVHEDDPVLEVGAICQLAVADTVNAIEGLNKAAADRISAASTQHIEAARQSAAALITEAGTWSAEQLREAAVEISASLLKELRQEVTKAEAVVNIDEITYGRDGKAVTGSFVIPRMLAESYVEDLRGLKVFVMNHNAPLFDLRAGDRLFVDTKVAAMTIEHDIYVVEIGGEMEVVRYVPSAGKATISYVNPSNATIETKAKDITVLGALVSTLARH